MTEITIEITDYCPNECSYCSSNAGPDKDTLMSLETVTEFLKGKIYDVINISGGEPLAHPNFWNILQICKLHVTPRTGIVTVYTNALESIRFNANVIPAVHVEANLPVAENTEKIHILKLIKQGCAAEKPDIHFSKNWNGNCKECDHQVLRPDGVLVKSPCQKFDKA